MRYSKALGVLMLIGVALLLAVFKESTSLQATEVHYDQSIFPKNDSSSRIVHPSLHDQHQDTAWRRCPPAAIMGNVTYWTDTKDHWVWTNANRSSDDGTVLEDQVIRIPKSFPSKRSFQDIAGNETSVVFYGSSFIRELYFALIRLQRGNVFNQTLEEAVMFVPSCEHVEDCNRVDKAGVDLEICGLPGRRRVPELSERVAIGFKTYLHTPDADENFIDFLSDHGLRHPDVLVVDVGVWGTRGGRLGGTATFVMKPEDEIDYYLRWLQMRFPRTVLTFIKDIPARSTALIQALVNNGLADFLANNSNSSVIFPKNLLQTTMDIDAPCGHGCSGPVVVVLANLFLDWLGSVAQMGQGQCLPGRVR